jgi:hypothetical protein
MTPLVAELKRPDERQYDIRMLIDEVVPVTGIEPMTY